MDINKFKEYLLEQGYRPTLDEDGDLVFRNEGKYFFISIDSDDDKFIRLVAPNIWEIESEHELQQAFIQANRATCSLKSAKVFVLKNQKNVWATIEMFVPDEQAFIAVFPRCLEVVARAVSRFQADMRSATTADAEETLN